VLPGTDDESLIGETKSLIRQTPRLPNLTRWSTGAAPAFGSVGDRNQVSRGRKENLPPHWQIISFPRPWPWCPQEGPNPDGTDVIQYSL